MKHPHTISIPDDIWGYLSKTGNASEAIRQLVEGKMNKNVDLANKIYNAISGADNKQEYNALVGEIEDWLNEGDPDAFSLDELCAMWIEYSSEEEV